jgi:hypothetical protein
VLEWGCVLLKKEIENLQDDAFGRQTKEFLPLASGQSNLAYIDGATASANIVSQYQTWYGDQNPYSEKQLENSPLNRVLKQAAPGNPPLPRESFRVVSIINMFFNFTFSQKVN